MKTSLSLYFSLSLFIPIGSLTALRNQPSRSSRRRVVGFITEGRGRKPGSGITRETLNCSDELSTGNRKLGKLQFVTGEQFGTPLDSTWTYRSCPTLTNNGFVNSLNEEGSVKIIMLGRKRSTKSIHVDSEEYK